MSKPHKITKKRKQAIRAVLVSTLVQAWQTARDDRELMRRQVEIRAGCPVTIHYTTELNWVQVIVADGLQPLLREYLGPEARVLGPYGILCELMLIEDDDARHGKALTLRFRSQTAPGLYFVLPETKRSRQFKPNTIGAINGCNNPTIRIPDDFTVGQLIDVMQMGARDRKAFFKTLK